MKLQVTMKSQI